MKSESVTIQLKATEQYFSLVLFIILYKMVLTRPVARLKQLRGLSKMVKQNYAPSLKNRLIWEFKGELSRRFC